MCRNITELRGLEPPATGEEMVSRENPVTNHFSWPVGRSYPHNRPFPSTTSSSCPR